MENNKSERKKLLKINIELNVAKNFLMMELVLMEIDVNFFIKKIQYNVKNNSIEKECLRFIKTLNYSF
jgi:hypothetical protein